MHSTTPPVSITPIDSVPFTTLQPLLSKEFSDSCYKDRAIYSSQECLCSHPSAQFMAFPLGCKWPCSSGSIVRAPFDRSALIIGSIEGFGLMCYISLYQFWLLLSFVRVDFNLTEMNGKRYLMLIVFSQMVIVSDMKHSPFHDSLVDPVIIFFSGGLKLVVCLLPSITD